MKNITDYIKEYGKYTLDEMAFNDVDSLILSQLSYLKYDGMIPGVNDQIPPLTIAELSKHPNCKNLFSDERYAKVNRGLFRAALHSRRFSGMKLNYYVNIVDVGWEIQFSAVTFLFDENHVYIAFRGTDETIVGWKEDFNMAFQTPVPAQEKAVQYLNVVTENFAGDFMVGGHSKGGNLAVYSSMMCRPETRDRIIKIYSHDGPGFRQDVLDSGEYSAIGSRVQKLVPHSSIIGMLLQSQETYEVVECKSFGFFQHDPFNWIVEEADFKHVSKLYKHVEMQDQSVNQWICGMDKEQLKQFVEQLFTVLNAPGVSTVTDLKSDWLKNSAAIKEAIDDMDEESKKMMHLVAKGLFKEMSEVIKLKVAEKVQPEIEKIQLKIEK